MMTFENVKSCLDDPDLMAILAPSLFNPTPERVAARAAAYMGDSDVAAYACQANGVHTGLIVFSIEGNTAVIRAIATGSAFRHMGVGRFLVEQVMGAFHPSTLIAETDDDAVGFYQRCGFAVERCGEIDGRTRYFCRKSV